MVEIGAELPNVEAVDLRGNAGESGDSASTGLPLLVFATARSDFCTRLEPVFAAITNLAGGPYNVWFYVHGKPEGVRIAYPKIVESARTFPVPTDWDGYESFGVDRWPTALLAGRGNKILEAVEGWDHDAWVEFVRKCESYHPEFRPMSLPVRGVPDGGHVPVPQRATA